MANFFAELKRRHIYRVAAAYAVVAWLLLQLVNNLAPIFELPPWIARAVVLLLIVGFPITLLIAWMRELAPADGTTARAATGKLDWVLIGALVVVIGLVSYQQIAPSQSAKTAEKQQVSVTAARVASASVGNAISIAVMPFANLSTDKEQEFFSDGMTDEISGALAKVPDLRVVARSSAFEFKGQNKEARAMGQALGATHLIEGSVRQAGNRVRVTAQLIRTDNGLQLWSENYDRDLTDIFAIQEDIARAITTSLRMPLGLRPGDNLVNSRTKNAASYEDYLRAKALVRGRRLKPLTDAAALLEQVVARDPDFAPAWALLALDYRLLPLRTPAYNNGSVQEARPIVQSYLDKAEPAARKAIQLDANLADGYLSLGGAQQRRGKFLTAEDLYSKALALDPNNPDALQGYSQLLADVGRLKESLAMRERLQALEPFVPIFKLNTAVVLWLNGQTDAAIEMSKSIGDYFGLAEIYAAAGRYNEAADALLQTPLGNVPRETIETAARLLRTAPASAASPQTLPPLWRVLGFVYLHAGAPGRVLESHEFEVGAGYLGAINTALLWHPSYAPVRKTERFKAYVRAAGLVDYWRAKSWPEFCHPTTATDFVCE